MAVSKNSLIVDTAITGAEVCCMDPERRILRGATVLINNGKIVDITTEPFQARTTHEAHGGLLLPGFVDPHVHALPLLLRGLSQDLNLGQWLSTVVYPGLSAFSEDDARLAASLFAAEALRSGITTIGDSTDMAIRRGLVAGTLAAYDEIGIRAVFFRTFSDQPPQGLEANQESVREALDHTDKLIRENLNRSRISFGVGLNEVKSVSPAAIAEALDYAARHQLPMMAHCAEVIEDYLIDGESVIVWLERHGLLRPPLTLNHCVHLTAEDAHLLASRGVQMTWQPSTNAVLADGIAPVSALLAAGVIVGLGTDDSNLNDRVDMFSEMRTAAMTARLREGRPDAITTEMLMTMATIGGAEILGMEKTIGSIEIGKRADLVLMDRDAMAPIAHLPSALIYQTCPSMVRSVWVEGRRIVGDGKVLTIDEASLRRLANVSAAEIRLRSGLQGLVSGRVWGAL